MDEEKIDLHPSEEDRINENVAETQSGENMEGDDTWYEGEVEDVHETRLNPDGTFSYLIQWKNHPEKYWTNEANASNQVIENWNLDTTREEIVKKRKLKQIRPVDQVDQETEKSMETEALNDPLKKEEIVTQPPGDVEFVESEEEVKKRKLSRKRKRTRKRRKNAQSSSSSGTSSSSAESSSSDSSSNSDTGAEGKEKRNKKKESTKRIHAKNADVKVKITSPTKKDIKTARNQLMMIR